MSRTADWLRARRPPPVMELGPWLERVEPDAPPAEGLAHAARDALEAALAEPGRVRRSAFELLAADALLTYACEAALEEEAPEERLGWILRQSLVP